MFERYWCYLSPNVMRAVLAVVYAYSLCWLFISLSPRAFLNFLNFTDGLFQFIWCRGREGSFGLGSCSRNLPTGSRIVSYVLYDNFPFIPLTICFPVISKLLKFLQLVILGQNSKRNTFGYLFFLPSFFSKKHQLCFSQIFSGACPESLWLGFSLRLTSSQLIIPVKALNGQ